MNKSDIRILIACEESQRVCTAFRERGFTAFSADIQEPSGNHPEWHILGDVLPILQGGTFATMDGAEHTVQKWTMIVAHPVCTYLTNAATRSHSLQCTALDKINARTMKRIDGMKFFMEFINADCEHIAVENPKGVMNTCYRKPNQIIHPYMFADSVEDSENYHTKATCLWTKGLPELVGTGLPKPDNEKMYGRNPNGKVSHWEERQLGGKDRGKIRSKTFPGIAKAIASQWGAYLEGLDDETKP